MFSDLMVLLRYLVKKKKKKGIFSKVWSATLTICGKHMESYLEEQGGKPGRESHWMWAATNAGMSFTEFCAI